MKIVKLIRVGVSCSVYFDTLAFLIVNLSQDSLAFRHVATYESNSARILDTTRISVDANRYFRNGPKTAKARKNNKNELCILTLYSLKQRYASYAHTIVSLRLI